MRISFDLDDTLICYQDGALNERRTGWNRLFPGEPLRLGARQLWRELHSIGVYTTSLREPRTVRRWLASYGLRAAFVLNQNDNIRHGIIGKAPRRFGIDCHIDNEAHVADIHVLPEHQDWTERILSAIRSLDATLARHDAP